ACPSESDARPRPIPRRTAPRSTLPAIRPPGSLFLSSIPAETHSENPRTSARCSPAAASPISQTQSGPAPATGISVPAAPPPATNLPCGCPAHAPARPQVPSRRPNSESPAQTPRWFCPLASPQSGHKPGHAKPGHTKARRTKLVISLSPHVSSGHFRVLFNTPLARIPLPRLLASDSAIGSQGAEDLLDNVGYESFCDSERDADSLFFL